MPDTKVSRKWYLTIAIWLILRTINLFNIKHTKKGFPYYSQVREMCVCVCVVKSRMFHFHIMVLWGVNFFVRWSPVSRRRSDIWIKFLQNDFTIENQGKVFLWKGAKEQKNLKHWGTVRSLLWQYHGTLKEEEQVMTLGMMSWKADSEAPCHS